MCIPESKIPGQVTLFINHNKTADDQTAIRLVEGQFNGRVQQVERLLDREAVLPALWIDRLSYSGLDEIRRFLQIAASVGKPAQVQ